MGIPAAVTVVNNTCCFYELAFIYQLISYKLWHMLGNVQSLGRHIDDVLALDCPWLDGLR